MTIFYFHFRCHIGVGGQNLLSAALWQFYINVLRQFTMETMDHNQCLAFFSYSYYHQMCIRDRGAALQLGGSIGNQLGRWFRLSEQDRRILVMCGMSAAFSAIFGTPIAAVVFSMEIVSVGVMYYAALVPCVFSSLIASKVAGHMGIGPNVFHLSDIPDFHLIPSIQIILLAMLCAGLSVLFCIILHSLGDFYRSKLKDVYKRQFYLDNGVQYFLMVQNLIIIFVFLHMEKFINNIRKISRHRLTDFGSCVLG